MTGAIVRELGAPARAELDTWPRGIAAYLARAELDTWPRGIAAYLERGERGADCAPLAWLEAP